MRSGRRPAARRIAIGLDFRLTVRTALTSRATWTTPVAGRQHDVRRRAALLADQFECHCRPACRRTPALAVGGNQQIRRSNAVSDNTAARSGSARQRHHREQWRRQRHDGRLRQWRGQAQDRRRPGRRRRSSPDPRGVGTEAGGTGGRRSLNIWAEPEAGSGVLPQAQRREKPPGPPVPPIPCPRDHGRSPKTRQIQASDRTKEVTRVGTLRMLISRRGQVTMPAGPLCRA